MRMFYLDTSAVNYLLSLQTAEEMTSPPAAEAEIITSVLVVAELGSTADAERRTELLRVTRKLLNGTRPLAMPGELLKRSLECVFTHASTMNHSIDHRWDGAWIALNQPELVTEERRIEALSWKSKQEKWYVNVSRQIRPNIQDEIGEKLGANGGGVLSRFPTVIRNLSSSVCEEVARDLVSSSGAGVTISDQLVSGLLTSSEHWRFFLVGLAHTMHSRAVRQSSFGLSKTPGWIDNQQSIYLAACDVFVTGDCRQSRMLRQIAPFGHVRRRIWTPAQFEAWLRQK